MRILLIGCVFGVVRNKKWWFTQRLVQKADFALKRAERYLIASSDYTSMRGDTFRGLNISKLVAPSATTT
ncbi:hypothetical protein DD557_11780 [Thalassobacter stenotrophicus]|nr:hypothetical protein DD557_11780 [Thalassobacter stenotrophicus]